MILATVEEYGEIWHSDFSENMSQLNKYKVQSAHFNKRAYSLHCTVEHVSQLKYPDLKSPYRYHYHLSDDMKHDFAFSSLVATKCIDDMNIPTIIRRKSDNCATQYKCSMVFGEYIKMAKKYDRNVIVYYGASGHGKGLVDAMGTFGVKRPVLKAVLTQNFKYNSAKDILDLLSSLSR